MRVSFFAALVVTVLSFIPCGSATAQITLGQVDDFSLAGSAAGWQEGSASPNQPTHNSGLGLDGISGHLQNVSDGSGSGGRWLMWNDDARWTGDYLASDVSNLLFDFNNVSGNGVEANVRVGFDGLGGWFVSDAVNVADVWGRLHGSRSSLLLTHLHLLVPAISCGEIS